jgi:tetraacyldisaccharide 4'-kinase
MKHIRFLLLLPISLLYGFFVTIRNWLYDVEILSSDTKAVPLVSVGNLTVGGTGKTPHVEFLIESLQEFFSPAVLSRGYKRKTTGFAIATPSVNAGEIGDEPRQIASKFPHIPVAVCENRSHGVDRLLQLHPQTNLIILDDAFQHRKIKPGFSILLTEYRRRYTSDSMLPGGNLREPRRGSKRANIILVTKCPPDLTPIQMRIIEKEINPTIGQYVLFSCYKYEKLRPLFPETGSQPLELPALSTSSVILMTGIVNPKMIRDELERHSTKTFTMNFPDHHSYTRRNFSQLERKLDGLNTSEKLVVVTEKDAAKLYDHTGLSDSLKKYIFVLPVSVHIMDKQQEVFIKKITDYVRENSRNN